MKGLLSNKEAMKMNIKKYIEDYNLDKFDQLFIIGSLVYVVWYMIYAVKKIAECVGAFK